MKATSGQLCKQASLEFNAEPPHFSESFHRMGMFVKNVSPKRVSRYRVSSCLPLSLKMRMGCKGNGGGVQESLNVNFHHLSFF